MSIVTHPSTRAGKVGESPARPSASSQPQLHPAYCFLAAPVALALGVAGLVVADDVTAAMVVGLVLVALWAGAGLALGAAPPRGPPRPDRLRRRAAGRGLAAHGRPGHRRRQLPRGSRRPPRGRAAAGPRLPPPGVVARRSAGDQLPEGRRAGGLRARGRRGGRADVRSRRAARLAAGAGLAGRARPRPGGQPRPLPRSRSGRSTAHAVDRLGPGRRRRGRPGRRRPRGPGRLARRPGHAWRWR